MFEDDSPDGLLAEIEACHRWESMVIARRLAAAQAEMRHVGEFDYVIINDSLEQALDDLCAVVHASRLSLSAQRARHAARFAEMI